MPERGFLNFLSFFAIFFGIFLPGSSSSGIRAWNIFLPFPAYLIPFWLEIFPERGFLIFWIFLLLFLEFCWQGRVWTEFGTKIFFSLSRPISSSLAWNIARKWFFNFFCSFFRNFLAGVQYERNSGLNFFSTFLGLSHPILAINNAGKWFFKIF